MDRNQVRKIIGDQFAASLQESGVQITSIPTDQLRVIVNAFSDSVFAVLDALEDEDAAIEPPLEDPEEFPSGLTPTGQRAAINHEEQILWRGRPYLTIGTRYEVTTERVRIYKGILGNRIEEIELLRVLDTKVKQHVGERMLNVGDVTLFSADKSTPKIVLHNVRDPIEVRELIRRAVKAEKERRGIYYREDLSEGGTV
jgi:hypothetical protein